MASELRWLFSPIQVGRLTLKNRIYSSGHAEAMAEGGRPGERLRRYHESKARGGCALTIFGGSSSVHDSSPAAACEQIAELVRAFGEAARRCREGGLDGIELSMAHNHLIDQFWSPLFNERLDEYGGSLENRMRFGLEVLQETRRRVGRDFVVGARISGDEFTRGGLTAADMAEIARRLATSGLVDFLSIIGGGAHTYELQAAAVPNMSYSTGVFVPLAAAIKH